MNDQAQLVRLDAASGAVIWRADMPYFDTAKAKKQKSITAHYGPVLAGGRIAVASGDGLLRFFSPLDGAMVATAPIPGGAATQPALAGNAFRCRCQWATSRFPLGVIRCIGNSLT
ncbi:PQQ-binding-like beta-propeller repeat protein [Gemmobacter lanyuensis]